MSSQKLHSAPFQHVHIIGRCQYKSCRLYILCFTVFNVHNHPLHVYAFNIYFFALVVFFTIYRNILFVYVYTPVVMFVITRCTFICSAFAVLVFSFRSISFFRWTVWKYPVAICCYLCAISINVMQVIVQYVGWVCHKKDSHHVKSAETWLVVILSDWMKYFI